MSSKGETADTGNHEMVAGLAVAPFHRSEIGVSALGSHGPEAGPVVEEARDAAEISRRVITTSYIPRSPGEGGRCKATWKRELPWRGD